MRQGRNRRDFLRVAAAGSLTAAFGGRARGGPNDRLNIGIIGTSGRALGNIEGVEGENVVAICEIDDALLARASERFSNAKTFVDFRKLIEMPGIDGVVISTADHTHAPAAAMALRLGKHVYCEKPLTHSVFEARTLAKLAAEAKVATQMGTQIHATDNYRRVVELVKSEAIGPVKEVHVWLGSANWSGGTRPTEKPPIPSGLHWDLWIGPAPDRPYHPTYQPATWRRWWDFGNGTLGDMGCHFIDLPFWALDLRYPTTITAEGPPPDAETAPERLVVKYQFPARGQQPPVSLTWYQGGQRPELLTDRNVKGWENGVLFVGEKGMLIADYGRRKLLPEDSFRDFTAPEQSIPKSIGHHAEWIAACKDGRPTTCNFDYSGALTESVLLGSVAYRSGKALEWDGPAMKATNCPEAEAFLRRDYRKGWTL
ncbi:Gfo/Idh/MocA family protein [Tundrisphaera lichenicola]|uniref:Gfo/Idh/MocA family protein n=1 Tax=Tundrisphaera lichenicola TaxID=2029860 RepID=UPI003EB9E0CB